MKAFIQIIHCAYRWYDENKTVAGKTNERVACVLHVLTGTASAAVVPIRLVRPTHLFPWSQKADAVERAKDKADAAFEFITKLGFALLLFS